MANTITLSQLIGPVSRIDESILDISKKQLPMVVGLLQGIYESIADEKRERVKSDKKFAAIAGVINIKQSISKDPKLQELIDIKEILKAIAKGKVAELEATTSRKKRKPTNIQGISADIREVAEAFIELGKINPLKAKMISLSVDIISPTIKKTFELFDDKTFNKSKVEKAKKGAETLGIISDSIFSFAKSMSLTALLAVPAAIGTLVAYPLVLGGMGLMAVLSKGTKEATTGAETLSIVGKSIFTFTGYMALTAVFAIPAAIGTLVAYPLVLGGMGLMKMLSKGKKDTTAGATTLGVMGLGILAFTGSMALTAVIIKGLIGKELDWSDAGAVIGTVSVFALAAVSLKLFNKFGSKRNSKDAITGSAVLGLMGISLLTFSACFVASNKLLGGIWTIKNPETDEDGFNFKTLGTIAIFGLAIGLASTMKFIGKKPAATMKGVGVVLGMSVALIVFAKGFSMLNSEVSKTSWENLGKSAAVIAAIGAEFAIAGLGPVPLAIGAGAVAMGLAGAALIPFGIAFEKFAGSIGKVTPEQLDTILGADKKQGIIGRMIVAMYSAFNDTSTKSILKATAAVPSALALSTSIATLAGGIATFAELESNGIACEWDANGKPIKFRPFDLPGIVTNIQKIVKVIPEVFIPIGETGTPKNVLRGLLTVQGFSAALSSLATGIAGFGMLYSKGIPVLDKDGKIQTWVKFDQQAVINGLIGVGEQPGLLTVLQDAFKIVGEQATTEISIPGFLGGGKLKLQDKSVINGFMMIGGIGSALLNLSTSMQNFANIQTMKDSDGNPIKFGDIISNISLLISTIPTAFKNLDEDLFENAEDILKEYYGKQDSIMLVGVQHIYDSFSKFTQPINTATTDSIARAVTTLGTALATPIDKSFFGGNSTYGDILNRTLPTISKFANDGSDKFAKMVEKTKNSINSIDVNKVNGLKGMYDSMAVIAKMKRNEFTNLTDRIVEAAERIVEAIIDSSGNNQQVITSPSAAVSKPESKQPSTTVVAAPPASNPQQSQEIEVRLTLNGIDDFGNGFTITPN